MANANYKDLLIETNMISHTGSGPVDPAAKEKDTKSPVEDTTGPGTGQAGTCFPNKIPPMTALKKLLAKEGVELVGETKDELMDEISKLNGDEKKVVMIKIHEVLTQKAMKIQKGMTDKRAYARRAGWDPDRTQQAIDFARKIRPRKSSAYKRRLEKEGLNLKEMSKEELMEYIKTKPLLKRVFSDPKYKERRDDVLAGRHLGKDWRKSVKQTSASIAA